MFGYRAVLVVSAVLAMVALSVIPTPVLAQRTYAWELNCNSHSGVGAVVSWNWTKDGLLIPGAGGIGGCEGGGTGDRPSTANGFTAGLWMQTGPCEDPLAGGIVKGTCSDSNAVTESFDPAKGYGTRLAVSVNVRYITFEGGLVHKQGKAAFSIKS